MFVKTFSKTLLASIVVVLLLASVAMAAPSGSGLVGGNAPSGDSSLTREVKGGITVQFQGMAMSERWKDHLAVYYTVTSETDQVINVEYQGAQLFDNQGNQLNPSSTIVIGNQDTRSREVIEGVPTSVSMLYQVGNQYQPRETYARLTFIINGERLVFRNVPSKP